MAAQHLLVVFLHTLQTQPNALLACTSYTRHGGLLFLAHNTVKHDCIAFRQFATYRSAQVES